MRPLISREEATARLEVIFPREAFDSVMSSRLAGTAVAAMIYVDAIATPQGTDTYWARPSTVLWTSPTTFEHPDEADRLAWRAAAAKNRTSLTALLAEQGHALEPSYAENSRETLRDETFKKWLEAGAVRRRHGIPTSSPKPIWALDPAFADLFDPALSTEDVATAAEAWRAAHLSPEAKLKAAFAAQQESSTDAVTVNLPTGGVRTLEPGIASLILKGVIEQWAPVRLAKPAVITISEPGDKLFTGDDQLLKYLGVTINVTEILPDAILADLGADPIQFWIVEAVNTDGPIDEARKKQLLGWAQQQGINAANCRLLTAFSSRNSSSARRRLKDLAANTYAWYADEPGHELSWHELFHDETS